MDVSYYWRYTYAMVSLFGSREREVSIEDVAAVPAPYRDALLYFLFYGSEKMAYHELLRQYGNTRLVPNIGAIRKICGIVDSAKTRPDPEISELDHLFGEFFDNSSKIGRVPRLETQIEHIKKGEIHHEGTLLLLKPSDSSSKRFIGRDKLRGGSHSQNTIPPRWTFPMTYSDHSEPPFISVLRVLQQEVFPQIAASGMLGVDSALTQRIVQKDVEPIFELHQYDVLLKVYELTIPKELVRGVSNSHMLSRLEDAGFANVNTLMKKDLLDRTFRYGFLDVLHIAGENSAESTGRFMSSLNQRIRGDQPLPYGYLPVPD